MPAPVDPAKVQGVLRDLGVVPGELELLKRLPIEQAQTKLEAIKDRVRKNYKRLVFELHPDRTGGDVAKTELFKLVGTIKADFENLRIIAQPPPPPRPPPMQMRVVRIVTWTSAGAAYTSTAASSTGTINVGGMPFRVATMKPT